MSARQALVVVVRLGRRMIGTLFAVMLVGVVASACGSSGASSTATTTGSSTTQPAKPQAAPPLSQLTASVQAQISGTGASDFSVSGVSKVTCTLPAVWQTGATFKCFAYDFAQDEMGEYDGTVQAPSGGTAQWDGLWSPK
jgi:hypothetical protein